MKVYNLFSNGFLFCQDSEYLSGSPQLTSLQEISEQVKRGQEYLRSVSIDDIIECIDSVIEEWSLRDGEIQKKLAPLGLNFLIYWFRASHLRQVCDNSLLGNRKVVDDFCFIPSNNYEVIANPKGIIAHWLSGNVPLLGMLSLIQGMLTKNANILKVSREQYHVIPLLLNTFNKVVIKNKSGKEIFGSEIIKSVAAIYFERDDKEAQNQLSQIADVRVAWGNMEAVETIMNLPKHYGTTDVIFGPRTSFMVIGKEYLQNEKDAEQVAKNAALDGSLFEQRGCNSPHTVFVEDGNPVTPLRFAELLSFEMEKIIKKIPKQPIAAADSLKILKHRVEYDIKGEAFYPSGTEWSVLFSENDKGLAVPCYNRTLFVRPVKDILEVANYCNHLTQSAGAALSVERKRIFAKAVTAKGVDRVPDIGNMTLYEVPWDGMFLMNQFVRWSKFI